MRIIGSISNLEAVLGLLLLVGLIWWVLRRGRKDAGTAERYSEAELASYNRQLPKFFLVATGALVVGGVHTVIKSIPPLWQWLWEAGYGGHLVRDAANSHMIIMGGGMLLLFALTWYVLPRLAGRPLYSASLATISFWLSAAGILGCYLVWIILGLVEGNMVAHGWEYEAAKAAVGYWHRLPVGLTSGVMGIGFWLYVANVLLTVGTAPVSTQHHPWGHLRKFLVLAALGFFVGTIQGIVQVIPENADWIKLAGAFGRYIDPISHTHVNLVVGVSVSLAAFLAYMGPRLGARGLTRKTGEALFWALAPAAVAFYVVFLYMGLILGEWTNGSGGVDAGRLAEFLAANRSLILGTVGAAMLVGFWVYLVVLWRGLGLRTVGRELLTASPKGFWLASSLALVLGTAQGFLQIIPTTARFLTVPEEVPHVHSQLNMVGGVLLALLGTVYLLLPELVGREADRRLVRRSLWGIGGGIGGYYLVTIAAGFLRLGYLQQGFNDAQAAARLGWMAPALLLFMALPMLAGYLAAGGALWRATGEYRAAWRAELSQVSERVHGRPAPWRKRFPRGYFILAEAGFALLGFPGLGWILSGHAMVGGILMIGGPIVLWVFIPILMALFEVNAFNGIGPLPMLIYLPSSALLSVACLWFSVKRRQPLAGRQKVAGGPSQG